MALGTYKDHIKKIVPNGLWEWARGLKWRLVDLRANLGFILSPVPGVGLGARAKFVSRMSKISKNVDCPHSNDEIFAFVRRIFELGPQRDGVFVEAGCFKGGSSAKFSIACAMVGRRLVLCDSFEGIPSNDEDHGRTIFGSSADFPEGSYAGSLEEVKNNIRNYGEIDVCDFVVGYFDQSLQGFDQEVIAVYLDVDLASSTRTCIEHFHPRIKPGGYLLSQDGHLPLVINVFEDADFWQNTVGVPLPVVDGLWKKKIIEMQVS